jgi:hypothetical protein
VWYLGRAAWFEEGKKAITDEHRGTTKIRPRDIHVIRWRFK